VRPLSDPDRIPGPSWDKRDHLFVSNEFSDTVSSYELTGNGTLAPIDEEPTGGIASCWLVVTKDSRYAHVTNPISANTVWMLIQKDGVVTRIGESPNTGLPTDEDISNDNRYLLRARDRLRLEHVHVHRRPHRPVPDQQGRQPGLPRDDRCAEVRSLP
jgi:hypothetical protein